MGPLFKPLATAVDAKLGRCWSCMQSSAGLALVFLLLLVVAMMAGAASPLIVAAAVPAAAFTTWSLAHGIAYVARGPERSKGCRSCAERARARQRKARWERRFAWLLPKKAAAPSRRKAGCRNCDPAKALARSLELADGLPPADADLIFVVEESLEYRALLPRLAFPQPVDTWKADLRSSFLYELKPDADGVVSNAIFVTRREDDEPISALLVTPSPDGGEPRAVDLRASDAPASAPKESSASTS